MVVPKAIQGGIARMNLSSICLPSDRPVSDGKGSGSTAIESRAGMPLGEAGHNLNLDLTPNLLDLVLIRHASRRTEIKIKIKFKIMNPARKLGGRVGASWQ